MSNRQSPSNDELEVSEAKNPLVDLLYDYSALVLTSRIGNYVYHQFDACLSIVEKTAKWSLPQPPPSEEDTGKTTISAPPLVRPLPWIFFLPALIALRLLRYSLSFVALLIGKQPVYPITMVSFLQNRRRKLRALKYHGLKLQRMKRAEKEAQQGVEQQRANTWLRRMTLPLQYIICLKAIRPENTIYQQDHHEHHHHRHHRQRPSGRELSDEPATGGSQRAEPRDRSATKKRNAHQRDADDSADSYEEASVQELLDKYASAEEDSSFHPSDVSSSDSNSDILDSDKSHTEAAEDSEKKDLKKVKKESNGHAASQGKKSQSKTEKPQEPTKQKSSLNVDVSNDKPEEAPVEPAPENGNGESQKEPNGEKPVEDPQKPPAEAESENNESKPADPSNACEEHPPEDGNTRDENQNASGKQSPTAMKEVKANPHQKHKQQQQHQPNQQQDHLQQQQQHHTTVNGGGGGGGGRKHKKHHHHHHNPQHF